MRPSSERKLRLTRDMVFAYAACAPMNGKISRRQAEVIAQILGLECPRMSFDEIAQANGVTADTVRKVYKNGMDLLRKFYPGITAARDLYE